MSSHDPTRLIVTSDLVLDRVRMAVAVGGKGVRLKAKEYPLLEFLSLHKDRVHTREELVVELYGEVDTPEAAIVDLFVKKLRQRLAHSTARIVETTEAGVAGFRLVHMPPVLRADGDASASNPA
jgi:DNA-binding response OmpR family regulator